MIPDNRKIPPQQLDVESTIDGRINENVAEPQPAQIELNAQGFYEIRTIFKELTGSVVNFTTSAIMGAIDSPIYDTFTISPTPTSAQWENKVKMLFSCDSVPSIISSPPAYLTVTGSILTGYSNLNLLEFVVDYKGDVNLTITQLADANEDPNPPVVGDPDLGLWFRFEETSAFNTFIDSSIYGNEGTQIKQDGNDPAITDRGTGINGQSLLPTNSSSGSTAEYTEILHDESIAVDGDFSVSFWLKPAETIPSISGIFSKDVTSVASSGIAIWLNDPARTITTRINNSTGTTGQVISVSTFATGEWKHFTYVYKRGTDIKIYINGVLDVTRTTAILLNAVGDNAYIGVRNTLANIQRGLNIGNELDELKFWKKELTAQEVLDEYNIYAPI
jgi:hypothetical protein